MKGDSFAYETRPSRKQRSVKSYRLLSQETGIKDIGANENKTILPSIEA